MREALEDNAPEPIRPELRPQPDRSAPPSDVLGHGGPAVKYLTIQEVDYHGTDFEDRLNAVMAALLDLEAADPAVSDPDLAATLPQPRADLPRGHHTAGPRAQ